MNAIPLACLVLGYLLVVAGVGWLSPPAGLIAAGALLMAFAGIDCVLGREK